MAFLPMNAKEMRDRGWNEVDFVYVCGDSYVDHPSFGAAIITRVLEDCGYKTAFLAQPNWKNDDDFTQFGKPRLGFMVSAGNIDSMVAHYTVAKRKRHDDAYTAGGKNGGRPDRAVTVYCNIIRKLYPDSPIIIGGLEASLRRFAHYDYWKNEVMPSIIFDSKADLLVYGMGELQTIEIAKRLSEGYPVESLYDIRGVCYKIRTDDYVPKSVVELPSYERVKEDKRDYAIASRRELEEAESFLDNPRFKGYISDVGGPTANFRLPSCEKQKKLGLCKNRRCLAPTPCPNMQVSHTEYLDILRKLRNLKGIKKVFIRSGIRFDYLIEDENDEFFRELVKYHISGQLRVAPEHCSAAVLDKMGKPHIESYKRFCKMFYDFTGKENKDQYVVPYLMSSHPGSTLSDAVELALFCKHENIHPKQVQDFYPTPGTISTSMFYTELDPYTLKEVYVPKSENEKAMQRALLQYFIPENKPLVIKALIKAGRRDLIGNDKKCLVTPMAGQTQGGYSKQNNNRNSQNQKGRGKNGKDKFAKYRRKNKKK